MNKIMISILLLVLMVGNASGAVLSGIVTKVVDGDTIYVNNVKIRMKYIDAPESKQVYGKESAEHLAGLVMGKQVSIQYTKKDQYGRILGLVIVEDIGLKVVNEMMVVDGYAWAYYPTYSTKKYLKLEQVARNNKVGMWSNGDNCQPWKFRKHECI